MFPIESINLFLRYWSLIRHATDDSKKLDLDLNSVKCLHLHRTKWKLVDEQIYVMNKWSFISQTSALGELYVSCT